MFRRFEPAVFKRSPKVGAIAYVGVLGQLEIFSPGATSPY